MAEISTTLNRQQAEALFKQECMFTGGGMFNTKFSEGVPVHRVGELFGVPILKELHASGMAAGESYNIIFHKDKSLHILYYPGFLLACALHNKANTAANHANSEAGQCWDELEAIEAARLDALDAEEERRAKRAAAKARRQEAAEA